jgi:CelD/BcsL family acetyltransferase involved in cellulose biosynthesis
MDIAVDYCPMRERTALVPARGAAEIGRVEVFADMAAAEQYWRRLERGASLATPYQRFDLLASWQKHVGRRIGMRPFVVTAFDRVGEPLFLWPFGCTGRGPLRVIRFLGSKHANFNIGVWRRDIVATITAQQLRDIFLRVTASAQGIDLAVLRRQPLSWNGVANPFALLHRQASVDISACQELSRGEDAIKQVLTSSMRSRLRGMERKLQALTSYQYVHATTSEEIDRLLDSFFALKSSHMAAQGLGNALTETGVAEFLREGCHCKLANGRPLIEIHALEEMNGEVLALFGTLSDDYRLSSLFNTYTRGIKAIYSPGLILLARIVNESAARGIRSFDLGVGRARYKSLFCHQAEPLFDSFLPFTPLGHVAAVACASAFAAKRMIKHSSGSRSVVQVLRRLARRAM